MYIRQGHAKGIGYNCYHRKSKLKLLSVQVQSLRRKQASKQF